MNLFSSFSSYFFFFSFYFISSSGVRDERFRTQIRQRNLFSFSIRISNMVSFFVRSICIVIPSYTMCFDLIPMCELSFDKNYLISFFNPVSFVSKENSFSVLPSNVGGYGCQHESFTVRFFSIWYENQREITRAHTHTLTHFECQTWLHHYKCRK